MIRCSGRYENWRIDMYPTILSDNIGVLIQDKKSKLLYREIKEALQRKEILFLRKKPKFDLQAALDKISKVK